jgi:choline dehydrogenase
MAEMSECVPDNPAKTVLSELILIIEADPGANGDPSIVGPNSTNLDGGDCDWKYTTLAQFNLDGHNASLPSERSRWRDSDQLERVDSGTKPDFDVWAAAVGDERWSYEGQLPYMKKLEQFFNDTAEHGYDGPLFIQSIHFPIKPYVLGSWIFRNRAPPVVGCK